MSASLPRTDDALPGDARLPGLGFVLDAEAVTGTLARYLARGYEIAAPCRARYVRYKPGTNCLVAHTLALRETETGRDSEMLLYGKCYAGRDYDLAVAKLAKRRWTTPAGVEPVIAVPEQRSIVYVFPNDCTLDGLRRLGQRKKLRRLLGEALPEYPKQAWRISDKRLRTEVVRYKPEKRAVVRLETRAVHRVEGTKVNLCVYLRTYADDRGEKVFRVMRCLYQRFADRPGPLLPRALAWVPGPRLLLVEGLEDRPWLDALLADPGDAAIASVAVRLSQLHDAGEQDVAPRGPGDLLEEARATGETLVHVAPELHARIGGILEGLAALLPAAPELPCFVHGDFHPGQVLAGARGIALLDFDRSYVGDPMADVGNFLAHLRALALARRLADVESPSRDFVRAYGEASGRRIEPERLRYWTLHGLFQLSVRPFRELEPGWRARTAAILKTCTEMLA